MRIISGKWGGRRIHPPTDMSQTRPTTDMAREGLFNILSHQLDFSSLRALDLFAGTGCISYELSSRGVEDLTIVEKAPAMHAFITKTFAQLGAVQPRILRTDVFSFLNSDPGKYDLIFADPPYDFRETSDIPRIIFERGLLKEDGWLVLEHDTRKKFEDHPFFRTARKYGTTVFSIFVNRAKTPTA
jgi:16S rRNA (guanine(966)-N(2))-methyltransferase RsmD